MIYLVKLFTLKSRVRLWFAKRDAKRQERLADEAEARLAKLLLELAEKSVKR